MNSASASCNCRPASPDLAVLGFLVENKARLSGFVTSHACMHASGDHSLAVILFHMVYNYILAVSLVKDFICEIDLVLIYFVFLLLVVEGLEGNGIMCSVV